MHVLLFYLFYRPSDGELARARKAKLRDRMTWYVIKDIFTYLMFLLVVSKLAYSEKDPNTFLFRNDLLNMFESGKYTKGPDFSLVSCEIILSTSLRAPSLPLHF